MISHDGSVSALEISVKDAGYNNVHNTPLATDLDKNAQDLIFLEWQNRPVIWAWDLRGPHSVKLDQSITFNSAVRTFGDAPLDLSTLATGGASGEPVTFALLRGPGTLSGPNHAILTFTGAGEIVITASQAGNALYNPAPDVQQTIRVNKAQASVTLGNLSQTYDGSAKQVTVSTDPPGSNVNVTYDGSATAPINAGSYAVVATVNDPNYTGSASGTLVICKAAVTVTLGQLSATYDGTPKAATATTSPTGIVVTLTYDGSATPPINAGSYAVVATVNDPNYTGSASGTLVICKAGATVTLGQLLATYDGTPKAATATTNPTGLLFTLTYNGSATPPINAGNYNVVATIVDANYSGSRTGALVICRATPTITWTSPSPIFCGTPLSNRELNAIANVPGTYSYTPTFGYVPPAGNQTLSLLFTPSDSINYTSATATTTVTVVNETFTVTFVAGENGSLNGTTSQTVIRGGSTTPVTALPAAGYHFARWTGPGGFVSTANPVTVSNVTASQTVTAQFARIDGVVIPEEGKTRPDLNDALRVMKIALGQIPATENDLVHADIAPLGDQGKPKGNGAIDFYDVIGILRMTVDLL